MNLGTLCTVGFAKVFFKDCDFCKKFASGHAHPILFNTFIESLELRDSLLYNYCVIVGTTMEISPRALLS